MAASSAECGEHANDAAILSNVLLRAEGERLEFTATDLDVTIVCGVEAKVSGPAPQRCR